MTDVFTEVRTRVTAKEAAQRYGVEVKRDFAKCPFHGEKTASLHFHNGGFYCFGCHASGSSIDFVARLQGVEPLEACKILNRDFGLGLRFDRPPDPAEARRRAELQQLHQKFEQWREGAIRDLNACICRANRAQPPFTETDVLALKNKATFEYLSDTLAGGSPKDQMDLFHQRGGFEPSIQQILNCSPRM